MHKALCVAVLLLPPFVLSQEGSAAKPSTEGLPVPVIVAKAKLTNQTATIPTTAIYTPTQDGLYRLSVYATLTKTDPTSESLWYYSFQWTDDAGNQEASQFLMAYGDQPGPFLWQSTNYIGGGAQPFEAAAGKPITYNVMQNNGPDNSAYSLYYVLERLE
jgi:hypothetical protein